MNIEIYLDWGGTRPFKGKLFRSPEAGQLAKDYQTRIQRFSRCDLLGAWPYSPKTSSQIRWICSTAAKSTQLSSVDLADKLKNYLLYGPQNWQIFIGGPSGVTEAGERKISPDFFWNFGKLTFPHELFTVMVLEQIYRAFSILHKLPYHLKH